MTPLEIEMLLHIHTRNAPIDNLHNPQGAQRQAITWFLSAQLIEPSSESATAYRLLPRGAAYVSFLLSMPLPDSEWSLPKGWAPSIPGSSAVFWEEVTGSNPLRIC